LESRQYYAILFLICRQSLPAQFSRYALFVLHLSFQALNIKKSPAAAWDAWLSRNRQLQIVTLFYCSHRNYLQVMLAMQDK
jgi:hypothetical protein